MPNAPLDTARSAYIRKFFGDGDGLRVVLPMLLLNERLLLSQHAQALS